MAASIVVIIFMCKYFDLFESRPFSAHHSLQSAALHRFWLQIWPILTFVVYYHLHEDWTRASLHRRAQPAAASGDHDGAASDGSVPSLFDLDCMDLDLDLLFSIPECDSSMSNLGMLSSSLEATAEEFEEPT